MATRLPNTYVTPTPPSASETTTALNGKVSKSGDTLTGALYIPEISITNQTVSGTSHFIVGYDTNEDYCGGIMFTRNNNTGNSAIHLRLGRESARPSIGVYSNGTINGTFAPTPPTDDNSTQIATTAFVNNRLPYSTGTWTPTLYGYTTAGSTTITSNNCNYVKIGKLVIVNTSFSFKVVTSPTGQVRIGGLPFTCSKNCYGGCWSTDHGGYIITASSNVIYVRVVNTNTGVPFLSSWGSQWDNAVDSTGTIEGSVVYFTD